jgi:hypothetical protein
LIELVKESGKEVDYRIALDFFKTEKNNLNQLIEKLIELYGSENTNELINNEVYKKVKDYSKNRSDLNTYYKVGKLLNDAGKSYGEGIIKKYSDMLTKER